LGWNVPFPAMKPILHLSFLFLSCLQLPAQKVPLETARQVAVSFFREAGKTLNNSTVEQALNHDRTMEMDGTTLYYVFNAEDEHGYVLVSGDFSWYPILGFSLKGTFHADDLPPPLASLLAEAGEERMRSAAEGGKGRDASYASAWQRYSDPDVDILEAKGEPITEVGPLLRSKWNSGCFYNLYCPEDTAGPCGHVKVGCVAVAMAQLMNYYGYPFRGQGLASYHHGDYGELAVNFDTASPYPWDLMPDRANRDNEEIARLMSHCGISVHMDYGPDLSVASVGMAARSLADHFGYTNVSLAHNSLHDSLFPVSEWFETFRYELDHNRPVYGVGDPPSYGDFHAYIVDGYYGSELWHYNWGWGGSHDGYYAPGVPSALFGVQPGPCEEDTLGPNLVEDFSYHIDEDTVFVSWGMPPMAEDGDSASRFHLIKDDTHDILTQKRQYRFTWDTIGTYHFKIGTYDKCMHPGDGFSEFEVIIPDTVNYRPRIDGYAPNFPDTVPVYSGVYKVLEIHASDPNGDLLTCSWLIGDEEISGDLAPRLVHDFRDLAPGIYALTTIVSDQTLACQKTWSIEKIPGDLALIDDSDSIRLEGDWEQLSRTDAHGSQFRVTKYWNYYAPAFAEYIYKPEYSGTHELSAYIPQFFNLSDRVDYLVSMDGQPLDTFQVNQLEGNGNWNRLGLVELVSGAEVIVRIANLENLPSNKMMIIDALRFVQGEFDDTPPALFLEDTAIYVSDTTEAYFIGFTVSENSLVYLVPEYTGPTLTEIQSACIDSTEAIKDIVGYFSIDGLDNGRYCLFAMDSAGNISEPGSFSICGVGVDQTGLKGCKIFPNPANTLLNIEASLPDTYTIQIASANGRIIHRQVFTGSAAQIDLTSFPGGMYIIIVSSGNGTLVKQILKL
jgi:hypothetical protein